MVDSDEEPDIQSTVTKHSPQKKTMTTKPSAALSILSKNVEHKNIRQKISEVSSSLGTYLIVLFIIILKSSLSLLFTTS